MPIRFYCLNCGQKIKAQDDMPGMKIACPTCRERQVVPQPAPGTKPATAPAGPGLQLADRFDPTDFTSAPRGYQQEKRVLSPDDKSVPVNQLKKVKTWRGSLYFLFLFCFIPLVLSIFGPPEESTLHLLEQGIKNELKGERQKKAWQLLELAKKDRVSLDDILSLFPNKKLKRAWLPRDSDKQYYLALVCAVGFLFAVCICLPKGFSRIPLMLMVGGFTGVFGVGMLMILQELALSGWGVLLGGPFAFIILMIGIAYRSLMNPDLPFFECMMSHIFGVGLCEEIIKALPIFIIFLGRSRLRWHECCALGMASGIGFGIAEGVIYAGSMYNGIAEPLMYFVRFISCVAIHAVLCAAAALFLHRYQKLSHGGMTLLQGFYRLVILISIPMVLHGLYDTFLTKDMDGLALAVALFSFGWLVLMIESAREKEGDLLVQVDTVTDSTPLHDQTNQLPAREGSPHAVSPSPI